LRKRERKKRREREEGKERGGGEGERERERERERTLKAGDVKCVSQSSMMRIHVKIIRASSTSDFRNKHPIGRDCLFRSGWTLPSRSYKVYPD